jgi:hypothetical protein
MSYSKPMDIFRNVKQHHVQFLENESAVCRNAQQTNNRIFWVCILLKTVQLVGLDFVIYFRGRKKI